jgi:opacity protein-like surface antigen
MRIFSTAWAATAAAGFAFAASAADLPIKVPTSASNPPAAYNWNGCYLGAQAGWGMTLDTYVTVSALCGSAH